MQFTNSQIFASGMDAVRARAHGIRLRVVDRFSAGALSAPLVQTLLQLGIRVMVESTNDDQLGTTCGYVATIATNIMLTSPDHMSVSVDAATLMANIRPLATMINETNPCNYIDTVSVKQLLLKHGQVVQVYALDQFLAQFVVDVCTMPAPSRRGYVVNTSQMTEPGVHWIAVCFSLDA